MNTSNRFSLLLLFFFSFSMLARAEYAQVNGIELYYEVSGQGTPLVMLHGGYDDADMWKLHSALLSSKYRIIRLDSRGHGRSELGDLPLTYEQMTADTLALLDHLEISRAHFVGWSDGAVIASHIAARHPQRVNQLVLFGTVFSGAEYTSLFNALFFEPTLFLGSMDLLYRQRWQSLNPNPELWPQFSANLYLLWLTDCYFASQTLSNCLQPLNQINAPTLVIAGAAEIIKRSHTEAIANAIPGAQLKIVPFAGHYLPKLQPLKSTYMIDRFLNN